MHTVEYNYMKFRKSIVILVVNNLIIMDNVLQYMAIFVSLNKNNLGESLRS